MSRDDADPDRVASGKAESDGAQGTDHRRSEWPGAATAKLLSTSGFAVIANHFSNEADAEASWPGSTGPSLGSSCRRWWPDQVRP
jgi:hypothetical protein